MSGTGRPVNDSVNDTSVDEFSVAGARAAAERDELAAWVEAFLASDGSDNAVLGEVLREQKTSWSGPTRLPFDRLERLAGPPDQPTLAPLDDDDLETVDDMEDSLDEGWEPPPLIVSYRDRHLVVEDGNHRIEGLRRSGHTDYWAVVGFDDDAQRDEFTASLGG